MRQLETLTRSVVVTLLGLAGCHGSQPATDADPTTRALRARNPTEEVQPPAGVDPADQYALAYAIEAARSQPEDLEGALARTRAQWIGRRYRWEVAFVPALCGAAGACVVMPFDHHRDPSRPIRQGWLPRLELSPDARAALAEGCAAHRRCIIEVQADLERFELSTEQPTSLTLSNVEIRATRAAAPTESWVLGTRRPSAGLRPPAPAPVSESRRRAAVAESLG